MKKVILLICSSLCFIPSVNWAIPNRKLSEYFQGQIQALNQSIVESEHSSKVTDGTAQEIWYINQFSLRLRAAIGFGIEGFATFQVVPETEMIFQRGNPDGWVNYKPGM